MRTGIILPSFRDDPAEALAVAREVEAAGVDGIFCYDHLWPMGRPDRPALAPFPLLGAVASVTDRVLFGPLVARIGLVPDEVLVSQVVALAALAPGRVILALGTGDHLSAAENTAYGVPYDKASVRRASLRRVVRDVLDLGIEVWVGGGGAATVQVAVDEGATVNLWDASLDEIARVGEFAPVTWAGPSPAQRSGDPAAEDDASADAADLLVVLDGLAAAGATWAVFGWPVAPQSLATLGRGGAGR